MLRQGIKIVPGIKFALCYFRPASALEPKRVAEYEANILSVMKEVEYSERHGGRLDVALFLNGLPIATMEAKNLLTGSNFRHAEKQYRQDRSPAGEPLLTFTQFVTLRKVNGSEYRSSACEARWLPTFPS